MRGNNNREWFGANKGRYEPYTRLEVSRTGPAGREITVLLKIRDPPDDCSQKVT